jgi:rhomboid protease GluP
MPLRRTTGSVVCPSCGSLVGINDEVCYTCGRRNPGMWGFAPLLRGLGRDMGFGPLVIGGCAVLYVLSLVLSRGDIGMNGLNLLAPSDQALLLLGASGAAPVFGYHRWWSVLSAGWLHGSLLHIGMNMLWVRQLAPAVAEIWGPGRAVTIYTVAGAAGFLLSSSAFLVFGGLPFPMLRGAILTVGASAPIFGLLGALVAYGRMGGSPHVTSEAKTYAILLFVFGLMGAGVDSYAHAGGFLGGYAMARMLNPFKAERLDHLIWGMVCLVATLLAVVASVVDSFLALGVLR